MKSPVSPALAWITNHRKTFDFSLLALLAVCGICTFLYFQNEYIYFFSYSQNELNKLFQKEQNVSSNQKEQNVSVSLSGNDYTLTLPGNIQLEMVRVEAGTFTMGIRDSESYDDEKEHSVTLKNAFWIGKTEVTQAQWKAVMGTDIRQQKYKAREEYQYDEKYFIYLFGFGAEVGYYGEGDNYPMYYISYEECKEFCAKLNKLYAGKLPSGYQFDLPTEAQWEYAARGGKKSNGYKYSGSNDIDKVAWYYDNSGEKTHPVGTKEPNELGLYDMTGNVWEWCRDWYEKGYASDPEFLSGNKGSSRVFRGGSWYYGARSCRSSNRDHDPTHRIIILGLRLALVRVQ